MQATVPTITDLERGGGFYAFVVFVFLCSGGIFWLAKQAVAILKDQHERQIATMEKQISEGREELGKVVTAFERALDIMEAEKKPARRSRK